MSDEEPVLLVFVVGCDSGALEHVQPEHTLGSGVLNAGSGEAGEKLVEWLEAGLKEVGGRMGNPRFADGVDGKIVLQSDGEIFALGGTEIGEQRLRNGVRPMGEAPRMPNPAVRDDAEPGAVFVAFEVEKRKFAFDFRGKIALQLLEGRFIVFALLWLVGGR